MEPGAENRPNEHMQECEQLTWGTCYQNASVSGPLAQEHNSAGPEQWSSHLTQSPGAWSPISLQPGLLDTNLFYSVSLGLNFRLEERILLL